MKLIRPVFCSLLLVSGAFALQQSPQMNPSSPSGQSVPQNQPSQTQPPETQAPQPQQQAPQSQPPQGAPQTSQPPSIDEQVSVLTQELNLSSDQQSKVKTILTDQRQQAMGVVGDQNMSRADKIEKIHAIRESTISKVRESLNDDQKKKLDQMLQPQGSQAPPSSHEPQSTPPKQK